MADGIDPLDLILQHLQQIRLDMQQQFAAVNTRLDKVVTHDVHASDLRRVDDRMADLAGALAEEKAARAAQGERKEGQIKELRVCLDRMNDEVDEKMRREKADRVKNAQWLAAGIFVPIGITVVTFMSRLNGG